jgi:hypothetical protein
VEMLCDWKVDLHGMVAGLRQLAELSTACKVVISGLLTAASDTLAYSTRSASVRDEPTRYVCVRRVSFTYNQQQDNVSWRWVGTAHWR